MLRRSSNTTRAWAALVLATLAIAAGLPSLALAATPSPAPPAGDPRSGGEGPGFVGDPATAILLVLAIGLGSAVVTAVYVRLTRPRAHE